MKAILTFEFPEDTEQFVVASRGMDMYLTLWDIDQYLRSVIKHGVDADKITVDAADYIREKFYNLLDDKNLNLDMVS